MGVTAFSRTNKGVRITREGEELLSYARQLLEQADIMQEHFGKITDRQPKFSVSCQHYSFAVNAFVELVKQFDADSYDFILRETQTGEIIEDVAQGLSEIGVIYLSEHNEEFLTKLIRRNGLVFTELYKADPHVFISSAHPLAAKDIIELKDLKEYPYLTYEQGNHNSFYFSEEFLSTLDMPKNIQVRDRASLFNLVIGLNGFTVSSGVIDRDLNSEQIIAKPLKMDVSMHIGTVIQKNILLSRYAEQYRENLQNCLNAAEK